MMRKLFQIEPMSGKFDLGMYAIVVGKGSLLFTISTHLSTDHPDKRKAVELDDTVKRRVHVETRNSRE
jgi:hypothetical protein